MKLATALVQHRTATVTTFSVEHPTLAHLAVFQFKDVNHCIVVPTPASAGPVRDYWLCDPQQAAEAWLKDQELK